MRSPNSTNLSHVFPFGICFHRKVSAKAWNGVSFFQRNVLTNKISFWNILAAVPVLLDMVERRTRRFIYFSTGFSENLSTSKTTTPLTAILGKHTIEGMYTHKRLASDKKRINSDRVLLPLGVYSYKLKTKTLRQN